MAASSQTVPVALLDAAEEPHFSSSSMLHYAPVMTRLQKQRDELRAENAQLRQMVAALQKETEESKDTMEKRNKEKEKRLTEST